MRLYCLLLDKEVDENGGCVFSPRCSNCFDSEKYCKKNDENCNDCSLVNYGKDCRNKEMDDENG